MNSKFENWIKEKEGGKLYSTANQLVRWAKFVCNTNRVIFNLDTCGTVAFLTIAKRIYSEKQKEEFVAQIKQGTSIGLYLQINFI